MGLRDAFRLRRFETAPTNKVGVDGVPLSLLPENPFAWAQYGDGRAVEGQLRVASLAWFQTGQHVALASDRRNDGERFTPASYQLIHAG